MPPVARIGDTVFCAADIHIVPWPVVPLVSVPTPFPVTGQITTGSTNVIVAGAPMARIGDTGFHAACTGPNSFEITGGSSQAINGEFAARVGDQTTHCEGDASNVPTSLGSILTGAFTVLFDQ